MTQPPITGLDEWYPELEDTIDPEPDEMQGEVFRVVDRFGRLNARNTYYSTFKGAKAYIAGRWADPGARIQKGKVIWSELD
jgi:hypothetical protein